MYDLIFEFLKSYIFNSAYTGDIIYTIGGFDMGLSSVLSHISTIVILGLIVYFFVKFTIWLFRLCSGLFLLR